MRFKIGDSVIIKDAWSTYYNQVGTVIFLSLEAANIRLETGKIIVCGIVYLLELVPDKSVYQGLKNWLSGEE